MSEGKLPATLPRHPRIVIGEIREQLRRDAASSFAFLQGVRDGIEPAELRDRVAATKILLEYGFPKMSPEESTPLVNATITTIRALLNVSASPSEDDDEEE